MGQKAELTEIDTQDRHVAMSARGAHDHAVTTDNHLHVGARRVFGVGPAVLEPGAHTLGERDRVGLARIHDHAQRTRLLVRAAAVARWLHSGNCARLGTFTSPSG